MTTVYHAKYLAHELTKRYPSDSLQKLAATPGTFSSAERLYGKQKMQSRQSGTALQVCIQINYSDVFPAALTLAQRAFSES
jgi:hypothetical protein